MSFPHFSHHHPTKRVIVQKTARYWRRTCAWILAPVLIGLAGVGMAESSNYAFDLNQWIVNHVPWAALFYMPAGFALIAWISRRFFPGTQGSGIPQTIAVIDDPDHTKKSNLLSIKILFGKIAMLLGGLTIGASIGREGPTVQVGASIMHAFYGYGTLKTAEQRRTLALAGGAAGIAAAFNTPLAGIMFAMEELTKKYVFKAHSSTLLTVILSGLVSIACVGNYTYFGKTDATMTLLGNVPAVLGCGIAGGLIGGLFSRIVQIISVTPPEKVKRVVRSHPVLFAAACGLIVAILGLMTDGLVYGTSYQPTRMTLESDTNVLVWFYGIAKFIATLVSTLSGIPGGLFAPTLSVGAGIGDNVFALFPGLAPHGAVIILVMAAYLSGVTRSPLTSFIITMEMTGSSHMLFSLMTAALLASYVSKFVSPVPLYHALAKNFEYPEPKKGNTTSS